VQLLAFLRP
jgi:DNA invertase Pin-like site-specific DNA recombinase